MSDLENKTILNVREMKRMPVYKDIFVETGHPEHAVNRITEQLEDMSFGITSYGSSVTQDDIADGVKSYLQNIEAGRTEEEYRLKYKDYKQYFLIASGITLFFLLIALRVEELIFFAFISGITAVIFWKLSRPLIKLDKIWIKVQGKIYSGTKSREIRDSGSDKSGTTKAASTVYVHSEMTFYICGDSEIDVKRIRDDVDNLSKFIQKI